MPPDRLIGPPNMPEALDYHLPDMAELLGKFLAHYLTNPDDLQPLLQILRQEGEIDSDQLNQLPEIAQQVFNHQLITDDYILTILPYF